MKDKKLKEAQAIYDVAVDQWMHTDSGDPMAESIATAAANWATDNLLKVKSEIDKSKNE